MTARSLGGFMVNIEIFPLCSQYAPYTRHPDEEVGFAETWLPRGGLVTGSHQEFT